MPQKRFARIRPRWEDYGNPRFLKGIDVLDLPPHRIPQRSEVNRKLRPLTGLQA